MGTHSRLTVVIGYRESCTKLEGISHISPKYAWSTNWEKSFPRPMHSALKDIVRLYLNYLEKNYFFLILKIFEVYSLLNDPTFFLTIICSVS